MKILKNSHLFRILKIIFHKLVDEDEDGVYVIVGREGVGKSRLLLYILHIYIYIKYGKVSVKDIKYVGLTPVQWTKALKNCKKGDPNAYDEAGEYLNAKESQKVFVRMVEKTYQVVRGENLLTFLVLPDLYILPPYFRYHRIRGLFFVYKRGRFRFWNKDRLQKLMVHNDKKDPPYRRWNIFQLFTSSYPDYKGKLLKPYLELKSKKMTNSRELLHNYAKELEREEYNIKPSDALYKTISKRVYRDYKKGLQKKFMMKKYNTSHVTINRAITYQEQMIKRAEKKLKQTQKELEKLNK